MAALSRTISNIGITLGTLINFQASVHSAVDDTEGARLSSLCNHAETEHSTKPAAAIKRRDYCPTCDNDDKRTFQKGTLSGGSAVVIPEEELEAAQAYGQAIKGTLVLHTHTAESVNGAFPTGKSYFLNAKSPTDATLYALVAKTLAAHPEYTLIGEASLKGAAMLYQVIADGGVLIMRQLARPEQVRERPVIEADADESMGRMLEQILAASAEPFRAEAYESKRAKVIAQALAAAPTVTATSDDGAPAAANVDLKAQLEAALVALQPAAPAKRVRKPRAAKKVA